jgi:hypothetical protein
VVKLGVALALGVLDTVNVLVTEGLFATRVLVYVSVNLDVGVADGVMEEVMVELRVVVSVLVGEAV